MSGAAVMSIAPHPHAWHRDVPDPREATRLEIVSLACEIAVLTSLMQDELRRFACHAAPLARMEPCVAHRSAALELLSTGTNLNDASTEMLARTLEEFRTRRRAVVAFRTCLQGVSRRKPHRAS